MRKLLVCQHVPFEILGTLDPLMREAGFRIRYVNFGRHPHAEPRLSGYRGMVVLGGPMNVDEIDKHPHLVTEVRLIRDAIERGLPVLGVCLGAQLIAKALGAQVRPNHTKEIGWYDVEVSEHGRSDRLFRHFGATERIFQWHGDTFDLPPGAVHLARSEQCDNQAFRYGEKVYGLQFHLEVDQPLIDRWLRTPEMQCEIEALGGRADAERIRAETARAMPKLRSLSESVFNEFIRLFQLPARRRALPSR
jgi:GMP synthase (glutamine-hydrolysing)